MSLMRRPVLVLNHSFEATRIVLARKALKMVTLGKATVVVHLNKEIYPGIYLPSVIRLLDVHYVPFKVQKVTQHNVFLRDGFKCLYCGGSGKKNGGLELEHIIPKCQGGLTTWDNVVCSCHRCNQKKAGMTPEQAGMKLIHRPLPQSIHTQRHILRALGREVNAWGPFLWHDNDGDRRFVATSTGRLV